MKQSYTKLLPRNRALHGHLHLLYWKSTENEILAFHLSDLVFLAFHISLVIQNISTYVLDNYLKNFLCIYSITGRSHQQQYWALKRVSELRQRNKSGVA